MNNQLAARTTQIKETTAKTFKFKNEAPVAPTSLKKTLGIMARYFTETKVDAMPSRALPVQNISTQQIALLPDDDVFLVKLVHSSILLKVYGEVWLIDPVFAERASPFKFIGPKRFHEMPISLGELPYIDKVLISHNHYDHLDKSTIKAVAEKTKQFLVPLGVKKDLTHWGVPEKNVIEFDWWQEIQFDQGLIAFTPTQHFSGRALTDGNSTLWGSWVIKTEREALYFSGDSGYFAGFKQIGEKYGPFDLTMIETGAYDKDWPDIHMTPEQSVQAHIDLKGKAMMPIHNGSFDLAFHAWYEPLDRVLAAAKSQQVTLVTPEVGQLLTLNGVNQTTYWWQSFK